MAVSNRIKAFRIGCLPPPNSNSGLIISKFILLSNCVITLPVVIDVSMIEWVQWSDLGLNATQYNNVSN